MYPTDLLPDGSAKAVIMVLRPSHYLERQTAVPLVTMLSSVDDDIPIRHVMSVGRALPNPISVFSLTPADDRPRLFANLLPIFALNATDAVQHSDTTHLSHLPTHCFSARRPTPCLQSDRSEFLIRV